MQKEIRIQVKKDLDPCRQLTVIRLKDSVLSKGYTEIIYILDQDEDFHVNTFEISPELRNEVEQFIGTFINSENLLETVILK